MLDKTKYRFWGKAILIALLLVFVVRTFWVESYVIASSQMEDALLDGDRIIVNKASYGLRLPVTVFSIPFTFDSFLGLKSYSSALELPYTRIGECKIRNNDVVVYNHPLQTDRPLDKRMLCIGRCVAQPGDTVEMKGYDLKVNGKQYETSPDFVLEYSLPLAWEDSVKRLLKQLNLPPTTVVKEAQQLVLSLNKLNAYLMKENLPDTLLIAAGESDREAYKVVIPKKGSKLKLNNNLLSIYSYLIQQEQGRDVVLRDGKLFLGGKPISEYTFRQDYFWILVDNPQKGIDSRHLGFIPEKNIVGKASLIWFSSSWGKPRWDRILSWVR